MELKSTRMNKVSIAKDTRVDTKVVIICALAVLILIFYLFGFTGIKTILGMILLFFIPSYLILSSFKLEKDETIFFSFFTGFGLYALVVYYFNKIIPSLRLSMFIVWVTLVVIGIALRRWRLKTKF